MKPLIRRHGYVLEPDRWAAMPVNAASPTARDTASETPDKRSSGSR